MDDYDPIQIQLDDLKKELEELKLEFQRLGYEIPTSGISQTSRHLFSSWTSSSAAENEEIETSQLFKEDEISNSSHVTSDEIAETSDEILQTSNEIPKSSNEISKSSDENPMSISRVEDSKLQMSSSCDSATTGEMKLESRVLLLFYIKQFKIKRSWDVALDTKRRKLADIAISDYLHRYSHTISIESWCIGAIPTQLQLLCGATLNNTQIHGALPESIYI